MTGRVLLRRMFLDLCSLGVPIECPCGTEGVLLCPECRDLLHAGPRQVQSVCPALQVVLSARIREDGARAPIGVDYASPFPVWALGEYAGVLQKLVVDWKNRGALLCTSALAEALLPVIQEVLDGADPAGFRLVPIPSGLRSRIRRGEDHTALLATALSRRSGVPSCRIRGRLSSSQAGKGTRQRRRRTFLDARARDRRSVMATEVPAPKLILIDDVVTTGATLRAVHESIGFLGETAAAVVVASARWPSPIRL